MLGCTADVCTAVHGVRQVPLKMKALADSKLAVWQREDGLLCPAVAVRGSATSCFREDLGSILAFDDFDGALEQDSKACVLAHVFRGTKVSKTFCRCEAFARFSSSRRFPSSSCSALTLAAPILNLHLGQLPFSPLLLCVLLLTKD